MRATSRVLGCHPWAVNTARRWPSLRVQSTKCYCSKYCRRKRAIERGLQVRGKHGTCGLFCPVVLATLIVRLTTPGAHVYTVLWRGKRAAPVSGSRATKESSTASTVRRLAVPSGVVVTVSVVVCFQALILAVWSGLLARWSIVLGINVPNKQPAKLILG